MLAAKRLPLDAPLCSSPKSHCVYLERTEKLDKVFRVRCPHKGVLTQGCLPVRIQQEGPICKVESPLISVELNECTLTFDLSTFRTERLAPRGLSVVLDHGCQAD